MAKPISLVFTGLGVLLIIMSILSYFLGWPTSPLTMLIAGITLWFVGYEIKRFE